MVWSFGSWNSWLCGRWRGELPCGLFEGGRDLFEVFLGEPDRALPVGGGDPQAGVAAFADATVEPGVAGGAEAFGHVGRGEGVIDAHAARPFPCVRLPRWEFVVVLLGTLTSKSASTGTPSR